MSVEHAPETGTTDSGTAAKAPGASIENLSQREASERHVPVMLDRCINLLAPGIERAVEERGTAYVIDGTLGMGGHSEALLERFENLVLIGIDRDLQAHAIAGERLARFGERFVPVHAVYDEIDRAMETAGVQGIDGILMDLGVSSMQLDERTRGFAYSYDAPLDMRMNSEDELTAPYCCQRIQRRPAAPHYPQLGRREVRIAYRPRHLHRPRQHAPGNHR